MVLRRAFFVVAVVVLLPSAALALEVSEVRGVLEFHPVIASVRKHRAKVVIKDQRKADHHAMFVNDGLNPFLIVCPKSAQSLALIERAPHHEAGHMAHCCWGKPPFTAAKTQGPMQSKRV